MDVDESEKKEKKERKRREKHKDGDSLESDSGIEEKSSGSDVNECHKKRKRKETVVESEEKSSVGGTSEGEKKKNKKKKKKRKKDGDGVELLVEDDIDWVDEKVVDSTSRSEKKKKKKSKREEWKDREFEIVVGNGEGGGDDETSSSGKKKLSGSHDKGTVNATSGSEQKKSKKKNDGESLELALENLTGSVDEKDSSSGKKEPSCSHDMGSGSEKMKGNEKEKKKKKKRKKKKDGDNSKLLLENAVGSLKRKHAVSREKGAVNDAGESVKKRKKKDSKDGNILPKKTKRTNADGIGEKTSSSSMKKSKRVSFKGDVEEFPPPEDDDVSKYDENNLIRGKRFSPEEDQLIRDAVYKYIEVNQLGEEGLPKILKSGHYPEVKGCWKEIATALPWRPYEAVYGRGRTILMMSEKRGFTEEENDIIRKFHAEYGPQWRKLAEILGKHRMHIKDAWRRIRLPNVKKGHWSQDEYQGLFDLVNLNLRTKAFDRRKTKNVMIRENISWEAISDKLTTRTMSCLCHKWYDHLASPMVKRKLWADSDDYRLIAALQEQDACNAEDVEWDSLLETRGRSGEICRKRWNEMVRCIGGHRERTFLEQINVLAKRYCGDMLQYREEKNETEEDREESKSDGLMYASL